MIKKMQMKAFIFPIDILCHLYGIPASASQGFHHSMAHRDYLIRSAYPIKVGSPSYITGVYASDTFTA